MYLRAFDHLSSLLKMSLMVRPPTRSPSMAYGSSKASLRFSATSRARANAAKS
jgi:hypothetical protein